MKWRSSLQQPGRLKPNYSWIKIVARLHASCPSLQRSLGLRVHGKLLQSLLRSDDVGEVFPTGGSEWIKLRPC